MFIANDTLASEKQITITGEPMAKNGSVSIQEISLNKIKLARNSRLSVSDEEIAGLMQSIKTTGLLQPIGVTKIKTGGYEICYGNRRFLACSKLGLSKIPAIVHENKSATDSDLKNLTENLQRRNISLAESGRYMAILEKQGLSYDEIGVRLGISRGYVDSCLQAYKEVPKEFRKDLVVRTTGDREKVPGKIGIFAARKIINSSKTYGLSEPEKKVLFQAAKSDDRFNSELTMQYASAIKAGKKDPIGSVKKVVHQTVNFCITEDERDKLLRDHVNDGPFNSLSGLYRQILTGHKNIRINIIDSNRGK